MPSIPCTTRLSKPAWRAKSRSRCKGLESPEACAYAARLSRVLGSGENCATRAPGASAARSTGRGMCRARVAHQQGLARQGHQRSGGVAKARFDDDEFEFPVLLLKDVGDRAYHRNGRASAHRGEVFELLPGVQHPLQINPKRVNNPPRAA